MSAPAILLVALAPGALEVARQAVQLAFPQRDIELLPTLAAALAMPVAAAPQLLVLADPGAAAVAEASQAVEKTGLPRWAIVVMGAAESDFAEAVPAAEWTPPLLARVFRATLLQHELLWENLRLRGDLKTVARRISHDLRTPVGCIYTTADMLPELDGASVGSMSGVIKDSAAEVSRMIDRVSFVLKASADPAPLVPMKMAAVVEQALQELEADIKQASAVVVPPASWPDVSGVSTWLQVIWINFLANALQHGGPAPTIVLGWERIAGGCRYSVTDSGAGVPDSRVPMLFSPFDQLHDVRSAGIGLSIVQRLVSLQGGTCGYEKPAAGGARFHFSIPTAAPDPA